MDVCIEGEDKNNNGNRDGGETDPNDEDTDDGTVPDGVEVNRGTDPLDPSDDLDDGTNPIDPTDPNADGNLEVVGRDCDCTAVQAHSSSNGPLGVGALLAGLALVLRRRRR